MRIRVLVKPNARETAVSLEPDGSYVVRVTEPPSEGKANDAVLEELAGYFDVPKSAIMIRSGAGSRYKSVEIRDANEA